MRQHFNTEQSARYIVGFFVNGDGRRVRLAIQDEMMKHKKAVRDTGAFRVLGHGPMSIFGYHRTAGKYRRKEAQEHLKSTRKAENARMKKSRKERIRTLEHIVGQQRRALEASRPIDKAKRAGSLRTTSDPDA